MPVSLINAIICMPLAFYDVDLSETINNNNLMSEHRDRKTFQKPTDAELHRSLDFGPPNKILCQSIQNKINMRKYHIF